MTVAADRDARIRRTRVIAATREFNSLPLIEQLYTMIDKSEWADDDHAEYAAMMDEESKRRRAEFMAMSVAAGWWEGWTDDGEPVPHPVVVRRTDLPPHATMAHALVAAGRFSSNGDARRNGWDKPIQNGDITVGKRQFGGPFRIRITD